MKLEAKLDVDVVAVEADDEVTCLLTFEAPVPPEVASRPGETVVAVVDRSGSMAGDRLEAVRTALRGLVSRMKPQDSLGVVTFDSTAAVQVPVRPMDDHHLPTVQSLIDAIDAGGCTDLSAGYLLGLDQAQRSLGATGATVVLLSDGHANEGITDPQQVGALASRARSASVATTTIGIGSGYDEVLLAEIASQGGGSHRFAYTPDDATAVLAEEAGDILSKSIANAFLRIKPTDPSLIDSLGVLHQLPAWVEGTGDARVFVVALGDLYAGESRELLLRFGVPGRPALGAFHLADLVFDYVALPGLVAETITWPVSVNVVPGDVAAGRVPDPTVTVARLVAEAGTAKREAAEAMRSGEPSRARTRILRESSKLRSQMAGVSDSDARARLQEEAEQLDKLARTTMEVEASLASKSLMEDANLNSRGRSSDQMRRSRMRNRRDF